MTIPQKTIPKKSYSLLQSDGILWVCLEMGNTPKWLSLLGKMMVWGRQNLVFSCIFCMNNHCSQLENVQRPGLWLATAVGRKVAQGSLRQHKRLRSVETWEVLTRKHLFIKLNHDGKHQTCPIVFVPDA